ncbi:MAG: hypothetical protein JNK67_14385 [Alphaproteobacteria bacterium]|nr:hypothetical protein [Alphaproteobacteria bacterium]
MTTPAAPGPPERPRGYSTIYELASSDPLRAALRLGGFLGMVGVFGFAIWTGRETPAVRAVFVAWFALCTLVALWRARHWQSLGWIRGAMACLAYALLFAAVAIGEAWLGLAAR